ncbi:hypothetical protein Cgig2_020667 [Carnegiea gigantea]|uniref:Uncharacterized protein n=1 Tax=Carnegiea gigantea TaxID=171969 RepID=A0A9Q1GIZ8_9CARY|nr:hypothetical protein Cgig2_020667 [Carnegiea gigantea]
MLNKDQHMADLQMMNKGQEGQEGHIGSENGECEMSHKPKIRRCKLKEFNNQMSLEALRKVTINLDNKQKEAIRETGFRGFLHLQSDMISRKLALWLAWKIRVTKYDVHMTLGLPKGPFEGQVDRSEGFRRNFVMLVVSTCLDGRQRAEVNYLIMNALLSYVDHVVFKLRSVPHQFLTLRGGYLEDALDKITITDEEEEVNEQEHCSKNDEDEVKAKAEDEIGVSKLKVNDISFFTISIVYLNHALFCDGEVITKLEEFTPRARIGDMVNDFLKFTPPIDSEPDFPTTKVVVNCDVQDILMRCIKSSAQCSSTPLTPGLSLT